MMAPREQVQGDDRLEPEARLDEESGIASHRHRIAGHQSQHSRTEPFHRRHPRSALPGTRRIGDDHVDSPGVR